MLYRRFDWLLALLLAIELGSFAGFGYPYFSPLGERLRELYVGLSQVVVVTQLAVHFALGVLASFFLISGQRGIAWAVVLYVVLVAGLERVWIPEPNNPILLAETQAEIENLRNTPINDSTIRVSFLGYPFAVSYVLWAVAASYVVLLRPSWLSRSSERSG